MTCNHILSDTFHFQPGPKCTEACRTYVDFSSFGICPLCPLKLYQESSIGLADLVGAHTPYFIFKLFSFKVRECSYNQHIQNKK